ncbi:MAG: polysaccharide deacetylase family protein [Adhaeribacter sp.]
MKKILFKVLRHCGLPALFREFIQRDKVTILLFHDISAQVAEQTFSYLSRHYNIICLNDFIDACEKKDPLRLPPKALILTFDDGHIRNYEMLPVIKKLKIPITIFLCSSLIDTKRHFWFKYQNGSFSPVQMKRLPNRERLEKLSEKGFKQDEDFEKPQALNKQQVAEMQPYVNLQSHTRFHPCLPTCDDLEAREEIFKSKEFLTGEFGLDVNVISYPNGDYSDRDILLSKQAGYKCGITVDYGFNTIHTDLFKLKRLSVNDTDDLNELSVKASGIWGFFKTWNGKKQAFGYFNAKKKSPQFKLAFRAWF